MVKLGLPYATPGNLINQPPIGFYIDAVFFRAFGLSYATGVGVITLFGLGCVFLVYKVGKTLYGRRTGLFAAGIFALTPWYVVLSRSFLIDTQCLFFSLLFLLVGIWAVRKDSLKLFLVAGTLFGIALLTKLFAVFTLIPLGLIFVYYRPKSLKRVFAEIVGFVLPGVLMYYSWYELISKLGFFSVLTHNDFSSSIEGVTPTPFFLIKFFIDNPGLLLLLTVGVSVALSLWKREYFTKTVFFDLVFLATILGTSGVNMYLVLARGLSVPYADPVKYDYQALPAFCLLAASLLDKFRLLQPRLRGEHIRKKLPLSIAAAGIILLIASSVVNILTLVSLTVKDYLLFKVEGDVGFSFDRFAPTIGQRYLLPVQALGFLLVALSLLWASKDKFFNNS